MAEDSEVVSFVLDNGSYLLKAGIAGDDGARTIIPNYISLPTADELPLVGYEIEEKKGPFVLKYPLERGVIVDWEAMERIWTHVFYNELRMAPEEHPCHITDAPLTPASHRESLIQVLFETFNVPAFYLSLPSVLSLYTSGRTTGLVLDSGHSLTSVVPVQDGHALTSAIQRVEVAGKDLTEYLWAIMKERGRFDEAANRNFAAKPVEPGSSEWDAVRRLKETLCYTAVDSELENVGKSQEKRFELPDGHSLSVGVERFLCPEVMFQPLLIGKSTPSVTEMVTTAIRNSPETLQKDLFANTVISGGNTMLPMFPERLTREITKEAPVGTRVKVVAPVERRISAWIGGSILSSLSTFTEMWVTRRRYQEFGAGIVHKKCC